MNKSVDGIQAIKEVKTMQKTRRTLGVTTALTIVGRLVFGIASLTTSVFAYLSVAKVNVTLTGNQKTAVYVCIAITLVPAVAATGKYILDGLRSDARKGR